MVQIRWKTNKFMEILLTDKHLETTANKCILYDLKIKYGNYALKS